MTAGPALVLAAGGLAVVELDRDCAGQLMLSRPAVIGPVLGLAFSEPGLGAALGLLWEMLSLDLLQIGSHLPVNAVVSAAASLLLALGPAGVAPELAFPAGLAFGWAHARLETRRRRGRDGLGRIIEGRLARGQEPRLGGLAARELAGQALMTFCVLLAALLARPILFRNWLLAPDILRSGLHTAFMLSPWVAAAGLVHCLKAAW